MGALALGLGLGIFMVIRLRAEPVEDEKDQERLRSIEESLRIPPKDRKDSLAGPDGFVAGFLCQLIGDHFGGDLLTRIQILGG
jgi:hypothetical protein